DDAFLARGAKRGIAYRLAGDEKRVETRGTNVHPFFAGLLPEGVRLRALLRRLKASADDLLTLLVASGADCVGDVSVVRSLADLAAGVAELGSAPIVEVAKLVRLVAFSYLIANGDLHAKNVSLRTSHADGRIELTPAYDLVSTLPYGDRKMALALDGRDDNLK